MEMKRSTFLTAWALSALLAALALGSSVPGVSETAAAHYASQKVVYHNNGRGKDSAAYFKGLLTNLRNHVVAVGEQRIEIRVVDHGDGIKLLQMASTDPDLAKQLDDLRAKGVRFLVCRNTLRERNIDWRTLYGVKEDDIVPSGIAELVRLQQQGFIYIHP
jgi:intracellular sulfur oxidation DsrE/DsrF family protein